MTDRQAGSVAWVFPGQGSQKVGMGLELARQQATAATVLDGADETLGFALSEMIFYGPEEDLQQTANQQPAIVAISAAYLVALRDRGLLPEPAAVAGHSLGEYSALVAVDALDLADALRLVRKRGELMQEHGAGAMAAIIGLDADAVAQVAAEAGAEVANFNAPGQTTVSGREETVELAMALAKERGARRCVRLPVSAAFHSSLMAPVVDGLRPLIEQTAFRSATVPLVTNVDASPIQHPDDLRQELLNQICASVRWIDVVERLQRDGVSTFIEIGPGQVLSGLIGRIAREARTVVAENMLAEEPHR
ncbi:MAG: ACP S-malonyltransferase [Chloroflexota bacterium]|nr:ACP S-malonyltransferase [Chloroflexota bacterium]